MPPLRPRPPPKASISNDESKAAGPVQDAKLAAKLPEMPPPTTLSAMAPPPDPVRILEPEMTALSGCLRVGIQLNKHI